MERQQSVLVAAAIVLVIALSLTSSSSSTAYASGTYSSYRRRLTVGGNALECTVCEFVLEEVETKLAGNTTEAAIERTLEAVCDDLRTLEPTCIKLIEMYYPELFEALVNKEQPPVVCQQIGLCVQSSSSS